MQNKHILPQWSTQDSIIQDNLLPYSRRIDCKGLARLADQIQSFEPAKQQEVVFGPVFLASSTVDSYMSSPVLRRELLENLAQHFPRQGQQPWPLHHIPVQAKLAKSCCPSIITIAGAAQVLAVRARPVLALTTVLPFE